MKPKNIITIVLVGFVLASLVYLITGPGGEKKESQNTQAGIEDKPTGEKLIVYYLHNNTRCINCIRFERYTKEVIEKDFAEQLKTGELALKILNYEEPENVHFVDDYKLVTKAVIVVKMQEGRQAEWKNLVRIWELVGNENAFKNYIKDEVTEYLGAN